jgi:NAD(P)-dependent dehydrogenase (short-subunit alcohol dehydrogenase family)
MKPQSKVALVTGANRGIGLEVCKQLAKNEIHVILSSRNIERGQEATKKLKSEGLEVSFLPLDVTQQQSVDHAFNTIHDEFGRLDILVNNAGIAIDPRGGSTLLGAELPTIQKTLETNTYGPIRMIQKAVPLMKKGNYGRIVNISSGMGQLSEMNGGWPGYRISKVALNAVTRITADELQGLPILVNSVCPGWVKTDMGGPEAELTPTEGADTVVWLATLPEGGPSGGFFRERKAIDW